MFNIFFFWIWEKYVIWFRFWFSFLVEKFVLIQFFLICRCFIILNVGASRGFCDGEFGIFNFSGCFQIFLNLVYGIILSEFILNVFYIRTLVLLYLKLLSKFTLFYLILKVFDGLVVKQFVFIFVVFGQIYYEIVLVF